MSSETTVNMLLRQIIRENAIPLSLSLETKKTVCPGLAEELSAAAKAREQGYRGKNAAQVLAAMEHVIQQNQNPDSLKLDK